MEKKIRDYAHLYIGCQCRWILRSPGGLGLQKINYFTLPDASWLLNREGFKLLLRPLFDITAVEQNEWWAIDLPKDDTIFLYESQRNALRTQYLLSKGFDLFGLIEAGLALDKTKLPQ